MKNYIQKIRSRLGSEKFIHPAARIIIENKNSEILIIKRVDNDQIGIPAGSLEADETIEECIIREVREETGLEVIDPEVIGISSSPKNEFVKYPNGDKIQYFTIEFYCNRWTGQLVPKDKDEIKIARFLDISIVDKLPLNEQSAFESLKYFRAHHKIMLK